MATRRESTAVSSRLVATADAADLHFFIFTQGASAATYRVTAVSFSNQCCYTFDLLKECHSRPQNYAAFFKFTSLVALVTAKNLFFLTGRFKLCAQ